MRTWVLLAAVCWLSGCAATLENMSIRELRQESEASYSAGDYERTAACSGEILRRQPEDLTAKMFLGMSQDAQGNTSGALQSYDEAAGLAPDNPLPRLYRAELHIVQGRPGAARADLGALAGMVPSEHEGYYFLLVGLVALDEGDPVAAQGAFARSVAASSRSTGYTPQSIRLRALKGQAQAALQVHDYPLAYEAFATYAKAKERESMPLVEEDYYWLCVLAYLNQKFQDAENYAANLSAESRAKAAEGLGDPTFFN